MSSCGDTESGDQEGREAQESTGGDSDRVAHEERALIGVVRRTETQVLEISRQLKDLADDKKAKFKWVTPLVVAILTGLFALQANYLNNRTNREIARYEASAGMRQAAFAFREELTGLLNQIDQRLEELCVLSEDDRDENLEVLLERLLELRNTEPVGMDAAVLAPLKAYNDIVADNYITILSTSPTGETRAALYWPTLDALKAARASLDSFILGQQGGEPSSWRKEASRCLTRQPIVPLVVPQGAACPQAAKP